MLPAKLKKLIAELENLTDSQTRYANSDSRIWVVSFCKYQSFKVGGRVLNVRIVIIQ